MSDSALRPLVLVVDDNEDQLLMLEALLDLATYDVMAVTSVAAVRAILATTPRAIDALVADMMLQDGTAFDVLAAFDAADRLPRVAVVLSGMAAHEDVVRTTAAGFDAHLAKPTGGADLLEVLAAGLRVRRSGMRVKAGCDEAEDPCGPTRSARASRR